MGRIVGCSRLALDAHDRADRLATGLRFRPNRITVGVPWPGMYAPLVSMTCVRSTVGKYSSMSFLPNSRFMKLLEVIWPVKPPVASAEPNKSAA